VAYKITTGLQNVKGRVIGGPKHVVRPGKERKKERKSFCWETIRQNTGQKAFDTNRELWVILICKEAVANYNK